MCIVQFRYTRYVHTKASTIRGIEPNANPIVQLSPRQLDHSSTTTPPVLPNSAYAWIPVACTFTPSRSSTITKFTPNFPPLTPCHFRIPLYIPFVLPRTFNGRLSCSIATSRATGIPNLLRNSAQVEGSVVIFQQFISLSNIRFLSEG